MMENILSFMLFGSSDHVSVLLTQFTLVPLFTQDLFQLGILCRLQRRGRGQRANRGQVLNQLYMLAWSI